MMDMEGRSFLFGDVEIDVQNLRVTVNSEVRPLEPKSFRLLVFLVENPGRVLTKEEIMGVVWPDAFVSDNSLARAVTQIRRALDDDPKAPKYIETVPSVGYRFVGECTTGLNPPSVSEALEGGPAPVVASTPEVAPPQARPYPRAAIAVGAVMAIALAVGGWLLSSRK